MIKQKTILYIVGWSLILIPLAIGYIWMGNIIGWGPMLESLKNIAMVGGLGIAICTGIYILSSL